MEGSIIYFCVGDEYTMHAQLTQSDRKLIVDLHETHVIKVGIFHLRVGKKPPYSYVTTPFLIDVRVLVSYPALMKRVARRYKIVLDALRFHRMVAIPYAALPIVATVSMMNNKPWIYPRREVKEYGTKNAIEGEFHAGEIVVLLDDTVTTGNTLTVAIEKLQHHGLRIRDIVLLVDRGEAGIPMIQNRGFCVHSVYHIDDILRVLSDTGNITKKQLAEIMKDHSILQHAVAETRK